MPVIRQVDVESHQMHGSTFTPLVRPATGSTELCIWRLEVAPALEGVAHRIHREEAFVLLSGTITITIEGETSTLTPGDAAVAPADSNISLANPSDTPATVMVTAAVGFTGELPDGTIVNPPWVN